VKKEVSIVISIDKKTGALKMVQKEFNETKKGANETKSAVLSLKNSLVKLAAGSVGVYAIKKAFDATAGTGFKFATSLEDAKIGIASLISVNATVPKNMDKTKLSMQASTKVIKMLKKANKDTIATLSQLVTAFQAAEAPALKAGFSLKQTVNYTKLMTQAAGAMKVPMNQLSQELKSVLEGSIDINSVVAKNLGLTNKQIKLHKQQGDLYDFLQNKLKDFALAGEYVANSMSGLTSNFHDQWDSLWGNVVESSGAFDGVKKALKNVNKQLEKIQTNKEYMETLGKAGKIVFSILVNGASFLIKAFGGILMVIDTLKAGFKEWADAGAIAINSLKIKILEYEKAFWKSINIYGTADKKIKELSKNINKLKIANNKHRISIIKTDQANKKFVNGIDKLSKKVSNMADGFSKDYKTKVQKTIKKTTDINSSFWKKSFDSNKKVDEETKAKMKKNAEQLAKKTISLTNEITSKIKTNAEDEYKYKLERLNLWKEQKEKEINKTIKDEDQKQKLLNELNKAYYSQLSGFEEDLTKKRAKEAKKQKEALLEANKSTALGLKLGFDSVVDEFAKNATDMTKVGKDLATSLQTNLSDSFYDSFTGKIKSAGDFFNNIFSGIKQSFFKIVADMAAKEILLGFKNVWSGDPNTGQGFVEKFLGVDIPFLKFAKGTIWGSGRYGVIPGSGLFAKDDERNDKIPALISPGEAVIPASAVKKNQKLIENLIIGARVGKFANGVINNPEVQTAQFRAEDGVFGFKGGVIGKAWKWVKKKAGQLWDGVKDIGEKAWNTIKKIGKGLWDGIKGTVKHLLKNPELGWLAQIGLGFISAGSIPTMLNADLMSAGLSLATGSNLSEAFKGAGLSGALAGAGDAVSSLITTGSLPTTQQGFWEAVKTYPDDLWDSMVNKWDSLKEGLTKLGNSSGFEGINADSFPSIKEGFLKVGEYAQSLGSDALDYLYGYLKDPSKIFQYILDNLSDIVTNIATTITGTMSNPFVASLTASKLLDKNPLGIKGEIKSFGDGGLVHKRMLAEVAERGEPELITPLSKVGDVFDSEAIVQRLQNVEQSLELLNENIAKLLFFERKIYNTTLLLLEKK